MNKIKKILSNYTSRIKNFFC